MCRPHKPTGPGNPRTLGASSSQSGRLEGRPQFRSSVVVTLTLILVAIAITTGIGVNIIMITTVALASY